MRVAIGYLNPASFLYFISYYNLGSPNRLLIETGYFSTAQATKHKDKKVI